MSNSNIIVNYISRHSYAYELRMVEGLIANGKRPLVVISKNMPEIDVWRRMEGIELYEVDGYQKVLDFPIKLFKFLIKDVRELKKINNDRDISSIYIPSLSYWSVFVNIPFKGRKLVYTMHDPKAHNSHNYIIKAFNYSLGRKADNIVILSEAFKNYVIEHFKKKPEQVVVIPSGCESEAEAGATPTIEYDENKINFVFQGRIEKYKGLEILAPAYKKLREKYDNVTLTVAGSGDFGPYEHMYRDLKDCTIINKWLTGEEVVGLFNEKNTVAVLPYTSATQSGVINVAMPCGTPIIATDCGGITEQITDGRTGYIVPAGKVGALHDKMEYVVNHTEELEYIRQNGYKRMESLSWPKLAERLGEIL